MKTIIIDCAQIRDRRQMHEILARELEFPQWYGHNLDALYDCLTQIGTPTHLRLENWDPLADWARGFSDTLCDAALDSPFFSVRM